MGISEGDAPSDFGKMKCTGETDKALLVEGKLRDGKVGQLWVPKSVLHDKSKVRKKGDEGKFIVKAWWAKKAAEEGHL